MSYTHYSHVIYTLRLGVCAAVCSSLQICSPLLFSFFLYLFKIYIYSWLIAYFCTCSYPMAKVAGSPVHLLVVVGSTSSTTSLWRPQMTQLILIGKPPGGKGKRKSRRCVVLGMQRRRLFWPRDEGWLGQTNELIINNNNNWRWCAWVLRSWFTLYVHPGPTGRIFMIFHVN